MTEESLTVEQESQPNEEVNQEIDETSQPETTEGDTPEDEEELVVTIGEESPPQSQDESFNGQPAPQWVKDLRKSERELKRKVKELETQSQTKSESIKEELTLPEMPKIDDHDIDYDQDVFAQRMQTWVSQRDEYQKQKSEKLAEHETQQKAWQGVLNSYKEKKANLKVNNFDEAEFEITEKLDQTQQAVILQGMENPALVVYALGSAPDKLDELSKIKDPIKFAVAIAKLETQLRQTKRKVATAPEKKISSTGSLSGTHDSTLERLRQEAEKTGDYSKVATYKRQGRK
ncbi:MAG: hypothetical protein GAK29_01434 [Acinetobacter bereziniae]|uniref:Scaffolding protein n=1 Tax=Acinetobacter bereziniae TaxID=106648 RepID=A0A833UWD8_ACIBZ|nr:MAG: hypothetical protein GAK29_01434 [Acinetobacter bereziniae]